MASDGPGASRGWSRQTWLRAALLAVAWVILDRVSNRFVFPPLQGAVIWLPSGMALAFLVRSERREWPVYGLTLFLTAALLGVFLGRPLGMSVFWGLGDSGAVVLGAWLLCRWAGPPLALQRVRDVAGLLGAILPSAAFSATLGAGAVALFSEGGSLGQAWLVWWVGDVLGSMLVTSLVLAWVPAKGQLEFQLRGPELAGVMALLALVAHLLFGVERPRGLLFSLPYLSFPLLVWIATRYGPKGTTLGSAVLGVIACLHTAYGRGPFAQLPIAITPWDSFLALQACLGVLDLSALCLAAMVCERRRAEDELEQRVDERTHELKEAQVRMVEMARVAGMSEIATNVLHNVGNVLTSAVVNLEAMQHAVGSSRVTRVRQVAGLLEEHRAQLADFLTADPRGLSLPDYLTALGAELVTEQTNLQESLEAMSRHMEHIRAIVQVQQTYAKTALLTEECDLGQLIDDILRIQYTSLQRHGVSVTRELDPLPRVQLDKHKVMQILINLIANARFAMDAMPEGQRRLRVRLTSENGWARIQVVDSGVGIAPEVVGRLFTHGFTTRKDGHGFGLHSSALAANLLGGRLTLASEGPGRGATATLELPFVRERRNEGPSAKSGAV